MMPNPPQHDCYIVFSLNGLNALLRKFSLRMSFYLMYYNVNGRIKNDISIIPAIQHENTLGHPEIYEGHSFKALGLSDY